MQVLRHNALALIQLMGDPGIGLAARGRTRLTDDAGPAAVFWQLVLEMGFVLHLLVFHFLKQRDLLDDAGVAARAKLTIARVFD